MKLRPTKTSILDLCDETIEQIFDYVREDVASISLALSSKRLFVIFDKPRDKIPEAELWNNTSGPWKQNLMATLAKGWIPKNRMKLCYGCWRFIPFGPHSENKLLNLQENTGCSKKTTQWEQNWEVSLWMKGKFAQDIADERVRCPMCVLYDQELLFATRKHREQAKYGNRLITYNKSEVLKPPTKRARRWNKEGGSPRDRWMTKYGVSLGYQRASG